MPESYHYLRVRLQIEQQRFLNFGLESGILYADGVICAALQVNRSLLLAVLAEIKAVFESYATANGKYEETLPQDVIDWADHTEPQDLLALLCPPPEPRSQNPTEHEEKRRLNFLKHARAAGKKVTQTGRNLRTIIVEPKRLVWTAVDQDSFQCLISRLEHLNSFLIALLDSSQARRLQEVMTTTYLEVLQIRNDIESLTGLMKALCPAADNPWNLEPSAVPVDSSPLSQAIAHETEAQESKKDYLKQLVEVKLQHTRMTQLAGEPSIPSGSSNFIGTLLESDEVRFADQDLEWNATQKRVQATYRGRSVWVEWKKVPYSGGSAASSKHTEYRIGLLAGLLCRVKPVGFRALPCLGYIKDIDDDDGTRFGIVFDKPTSAGPETRPFTLRDFYEQRSKPSLSARILMCAVLARCVHSFHAVNWLHKGLQSNDIIFFASKINRQDLGQPFVSGFEMSRPSTADEMTEKPTFDPFADIYRHPLAQSGQMDGNYRKSYDMYSLGIILIEIAFWRRIESVVGIENLAKSKPSALREVQSWLLGRPLSQSVALPPVSQDERSCLQRVAPECGDAFSDVVELCLTASNVEKPQYSGEPQSSIALRLQHLMAQDIVKRLEDVAGAL
jgi:hypothetical protein